MTDASTIPTPPETDPGDTPHDRRIFKMGVGILATVFIIILLLFFVQIPDKNEQVLTTVIGTVVGTGLGSVIGFYYGSSMSSKAKDETITKLAKP